MRGSEITKSGSRNPGCLSRVLLAPMNGVGEGEGGSPTSQGAALCSPSTFPEMLPSWDTPAEAQRDEEPHGKLLPPRASFHVLHWMGWENGKEKLNLASESLRALGRLCRARGCSVGIPAPRVPLAAGLQPGHSLDIP